jgi:hypothetical protein
MEGMVAARRWLVRNGIAKVDLSLLPHTSYGDI